jgi:osmotically-inducible protein OsmY
MGARRRAALRERLVGGPQYAGRVRARRASGWKGHESHSDAQLRDRVRNRLGQLVSHPGAVHVEVEDAVVRLSGSVLRLEQDGLLTRVRDMPGVRRVINAMSTHDSPEGFISPRMRQEEIATEAQPS